MPTMTEESSGGAGRERPAIVLLIHGIRTEGTWQEMVAHTLQGGGFARVIPIRYGFLDVFRFLIPGTREGPVERVHRELRDVRADNPDADVLVVAHSFGTYIITRLLETYPDLKLRRLVLCGSIVPRNFRWDRIKAQVGEIVNDCGTHDIWPVLAQAVTWGYGASGTFGFGSNRVVDRFHKYSHSGYFDAGFVQRYWLPFLASGQVVRPDWEDRRPTPPWWQSALAVTPIRYLLVALLTALVVVPAALRLTPATPGVSLTGVVQDAAARPLAGASVTLASYPMLVTSGSDGSFTLHVPDTKVGADVLLRVSLQGYASYDRPIKLTHEQESVLVQLQPLPKDP